METAILTSIISSACTLIGVIITVVVSNKKAKILYEEKQRQQQIEIDDLKQSLKQLNTAIMSIPVITTKLEYIEKSLDNIKGVKI